MINKAGFTMMELLIAAAIIGVLAIFATQTFLQTSTDIRVEDAKIRARSIAQAAHRFKWDYPSATFLSGENNPFGIVSARKSEQDCVMTNVTLQTLVNCGYLDYRQYASDDRVAQSGSNSTFMSNFAFWFAEEPAGDVCFRRSNANATSKIADAKTYCTDGETFSEEE